MSIVVRYIPEFIDDFNKFSEHDKTLIRTAINKLREKPFSKNEGGYGNIVSIGLSGDLMSVKIIFTDIRIVYKLIKSKDSNSVLLIFASVLNDVTRSVL